MLHGRGIRERLGHVGHRLPRLLQDDLLLGSSAAAEFIGALLLQLLAGSTLNPARIAAAYTALMATFFRHTGGHLNPAVSLAAALSGHIGWATAGVYMIAQILGALSGAAIQVFITPGLSFGSPFEPSCHAPVSGLGGTSLFVWEALATFVFVYVAYPALFANPGYGPLGPLVVGIALFGVLSTAGPYTGFSPLNPALTFAGSLAFNCVWRYMWMYLLAQFTGAGLAALLAVGVFGIGPMYLSEAERAEYLALSSGPDSRGGRDVEGGVGTAAPAGPQGTLSAY
eukprot:GHRR01000218.1.p1 GENE.GHRR01000218.1~~GHRR01000218.1.p1  ORF type:complete len:284 (+),score=76.62 GHRR01000218.1:166-1017(+)